MTATNARALSAAWLFVLAVIAAPAAAQQSPPWLPLIGGTVGVPYTWNAVQTFGTQDLVLGGVVSQCLETNSSGAVVGVACANLLTGTSGGVPYFNSSGWASSGVLSANALVVGGGVGAAPSTATTGSGVLTAIANAVNAASGLPNIDGSIATGHCLMWGPGIQDYGAGCGGGAGGSVTGPGSSVSGDVATFSGTGGNVLADGGKALPAGAVVGTTDTQTLTNKSIAGSEVNSGTVPLAQMPTVLGAPPYITGASMWYANPLIDLTATGTTGVANAYACVPFWIYQTATIKALGIKVLATSTGNGSNALQGAVYSDLVTTGNVHRPGTLIDYAGSGTTTGFNTGTAGPVSASMNNATDQLTGPGIVWTCVQKYDATATYEAVALGVGASSFGAVIGSATLGNVIGNSSAQVMSAVETSGSAFGGSNWPNFTGSTSWTEETGSAWGPAMSIQVN